MIKTSAQEAYYKFAAENSDGEERSLTRRILGPTALGAMGAGVGHAVGHVGSNIHAAKKTPRAFNRAVEQALVEQFGGAISAPHGKRALKAIRDRAGRWGGRGALGGAALLGGGLALHDVLDS